MEIRAARHDKETFICKEKGNAAEKHDFFIGNVIFIDKTTRIMESIVGANGPSKGKEVLSLVHFDVCLQKKDPISYALTSRDNQQQRNTGPISKCRRN